MEEAVVFAKITLELKTKTSIVRQTIVMNHKL